MKSKSTHHIVFNLLGVPFTVAANSWQFVPPKLAIGLIIALVLLRAEPFEARILWGMIFGAQLLLALGLHIIGHILSSRLVSPPMTEARITPALIQTLYQSDPPEIASRVHLIRSLGGPIMNLVLGVITLLLVQIVHDRALAFFAGANLILASVVLLPFPTVDGEVIWREIRRWLRNSRRV